MHPRLIGAELVTIRPIARAATRVDPLTKEPIGASASGPEVKIRAQVDELRDGARQVTQAGAEVPVLWTFTFRRVDCVAAGWSPKEGDRVVERADRDGRNPRRVELYLVNGSDSGEILSGRSTIEADATDRHPSRWGSEGGP